MKYERIRSHERIIGQYGAQYDRLGKTTVPKYEPMFGYGLFDEQGPSRLERVPL